MKSKEKGEKKEKKPILKINGAGLADANKDIVTTIKEFVTGSRVSISEENAIFREIYSFQEGEKKKHSKYTRNEKLSFAGLLFTVLNVLLLIICYISGFGSLRRVILTNSIFYLIPAAIIPYVVWVFATNENFWAFHKRKRAFFYLCSVNVFLVVSQTVYTLIRNLILKAVARIKPDAVLTSNMILLLGYVGIIGAMALYVIILYTQLEPLFFSQSLRRQVELFKYSHVHDSREDRESKYDIITIKNLETGKPIRVKERDRMNQAAINGPSGTGKTSTLFLQIINQDIEQKLKNREKRQEELLKLIRDGKATIKGPIREFKESAVIPIGKTKGEIGKNKKALAKIRRKYADCGVTVIAPNASLIIEIIKICKARGIRVNVLDPAGDYSIYDNVNTVGINPFFVPLDITEEERVVYIANASNAFAEVLIATNQMQGAAPETYFTDIALSVSSNIAAVIMLAKNIKGEQASIHDVQNCISNFQNINPYLRIIEEYYNIKVTGASMNATAKANKAIDSEDLRTGKKSITEAAQKGAINNIKENPYYPQLLFIAQELLGGGSEEMFSQARGLRNLINKVLQNPKMKSKLAEESENVIDFDRILSENEVTVVNTAIELGKSASTAFGLFFILLHKISVLRRPVETRTPHFLWIDEASQYMHPCYEDMISLYRQYSCAVVITLQSLTQTEKSSATAYLKNVFLGAGTHMVFGRLSPEEMKLYSEMGGISRENVEQKSFSTSSVLSTNPTYSESVRTAPGINNIMEGADLRILDFLELTIFTIDTGRVLPGQHARVFFLNADAYDKRKQRYIAWEKVVPEAFRIPEEDKGEKGKQNWEISVTMEIPKSETMDIMYQKTKAADKIEEEKEKQLDMSNMSAQELFNLLASYQTPTAVTDEEQEDEDLVTKLEALNKKK